MNRHGVSRRPHRGFTLVEVLVAMLVMAIMAVMAWQGVDGIARARSSSQERLERTLRLNTVVAQWEQDLAAVQDVAAVQNNTVVPASLSCDGASLRLIRRTPTGLQVVAWTLRPDANGSGVASLERWAGPSVTTIGELQDSWLRSLQLQGGENGSLRTLTGLAQWRIYAYRQNAWTNCQSSGDVASGTTSSTSTATGTTTTSSSGTTTTGTTTGTTTASQRPVLPTGVRLVLAFAPGSGRDGELTRDVLLGP